MFESKPKGTGFHPRWLPISKIPNPNLLINDINECICIHFQSLWIKVSLKLLNSSNRLHTIDNKKGAYKCVFNIDRVDEEYYHRINTDKISYNL